MKMESTATPNDGSKVVLPAFKTMAKKNDYEK